MSKFKKGDLVNAIPGIGLSGYVPNSTANVNKFDLKNRTVTEIYVDDLDTSWYRLSNMWATGIWFSEKSLELVTSNIKTNNNMNDKFKKLDDFFRNFGFIPKWSKLDDLDSNLDGHDWEEMKKRGTVTETVEEKNGYKTITKRFVSNDGSESITSSYTEFIESENSTNTSVEDKVNLLQSKIQKAIDAEDFETAAKLRDERQKLMDGTSK